MRVFLGMPLPSKVQNTIKDWTESWSSECPNLRFVKSESLHITLYFFGEKSEIEVQDLLNTVTAIKHTAIDASIGIVSAFPRREKPKVVFLEIDMGRKKVCELYQQVINHLSKLGYQEEGRPFIPHITLARNRGGPVTASLPEEGTVTGTSFSFERLVLYESRLEPSGARYIPLTEVGLH